jgi:3-oxoacyl-[acyl-carrier protein] reductase
MMPFLSKACGLSTTGEHITEIRTLLADIIYPLAVAQAAALWPDSATFRSDFLEQRLDLVNLCPHSDPKSGFGSIGFSVKLGIGGRTALVCGGSRGLGFASAEALFREEANVVLVARSDDGLRKAADKLKAIGTGDIAVVPADITTAEGRAAVISACPAPDILVTNPGVRQTPADAAALSHDDWMKWFDAHFYSALDLIRAYAPDMAKRRFGRIVNISVSFIKFPQVNFGHSHAARLALAGAIAAMSRQYLPFNVTMNSVCPGLFDTDALHTNLHAHAERAGTTYEAVLADRLANCPAGRLADPAECGDLVAFLCSNQAGFISAQNIVNDGGVYQGLF